jgi:hypothetical protein
MAYDNRRFVVLPATEINNVNFDEVLETAPDTCRYSVDGSQTFVKYEGDMPPSVDAITSKSQEYTYEEILEILSTPAWVEEQVAP